jgi:phage terminase large subunit GpA-like protein
MMMPCTVIREGDLADRVLKTPQWSGERTKTVYCWPTAEALWKQYADLRVRAFSETGGNRAEVSRICNEFYAAHRKEMDAGAVVAWDGLYEQDELSAIQYAWNKRIDLPEQAFFAEYQNDPVSDVVDATPLTADEICRRLSHHKRLVVPLECQMITAFIDVQDKLLYYAVIAWAPGFSGFVVDYGSEPDQRDQYFSLRDAKRTLMRAAPGAGVEGAIHAGLDRLTTALISRDWMRTDGTAMRIDRLLIDANDNTDVVKKFCRQSPNHGVLMPSHGRYVGAASMPMSEYRPKPGERVGDNWRVPTLAQRAYTRHVLFDANYWKTFVARRMQTVIGDRGALVLFGDTPERHRMLADHITAEFPVRVVGRGRSIDEWKARPGRDNHLLDCVVGAAVAASMAGAVLDTDRPRPPRKVVRFSEAKRMRI